MMKSIADLPASITKSRANSSAVVQGALTGLKVLDCTAMLGSYCTQLLAGLGADVVRIEAVGDTSNIGAPDDTRALYLGTGKRHYRVDPTSTRDRAWLLETAAAADVVVETHPGGLLRSAGIEYATLQQRKPSLILTAISPFGSSGPDADKRASDLTIQARGGLMWLAGDPGFAPVRPAGHQSEMAAGLYAAVATLVAVIVAESTGQGQHVDISSLECVASSLENAIQFWDLEKTIRGRVGSRPREAGSGIYRCHDGYVYLMAGRLSTPQGWASIVAWLNEAGQSNSALLKHAEWSQHEYRARPESAAFFERVFTEFAASHNKSDLYEEGQKRGIVICPVNSPIDLLSDKQLQYRKFFVPIGEFNNKPLFSPRGPFLLSKSPYRIEPCVSPHTNALPRTPWQESGEKKARSSAKNVAQAVLPLAGIRVVDFTWVGAGPYATKVLADCGAEVIKIESSTRLDPLRGLQPFSNKIEGVNRSGYFANRNTNKKSITLNLRDPRAVELARRLVAKSDVVANSFAPGTMEKWGLGYSECNAVRPEIIYLAMPMHGAEGPHSSFLGYGAAISALCGLFASTGHPGRAPVGTGTNYPDHVPNPGHAALAMLSALRYRQRTGVGQAIELSQVESSVCMLGELFLSAQLRPEGASADILLGNREPGVAPHGVYQCKGHDRWLAIACWSEADWHVLCQLSNKGWDDDPRFSSLRARLVNQDLLDTALSSWTLTHDSVELARGLVELGIDAAPVQNAADVLERDEQLQHLQHWVRMPHQEMGEAVYDAPPYHLSATPATLRSSAPLLGEHTEEVCVELLGLTRKEVRELAKEGVLR
jgi:crotonobetainyl-CoA:carnitine CoA-transferase CaiB-like acyl-CoA transferase